LLQKLWTKANKKKEVCSKFYFRYVKLGLRRCIWLKVAFTYYLTKYTVKKDTHKNSQFYEIADPNTRILEKNGELENIVLKS